MSVIDRQALARDEAARWLVRGDGREGPRSAEFARWLEHAPENAQAWASAQALWDEFEAVPDPLMEAMRADALAGRPRPSPAFWPAALAACLVAAIGLGWGAWNLRPARPLIPLDAAPSLTASGVTTFTLADGTRATLDDGAALVVAFDGKWRAVRLVSGRAYLAIAPETGRQFVTLAGDRTITDLGTQFSVALARGELEVFVAQGKVAVAGEEDVALTPGQRLRTVAGEDRVDTPVGREGLAWREPTLEFAGQPLDTVVAQINRYGGPPARVVDPRAARLKVGGAFKAGDPTRFARTLVELYPLALRARPDGGVDILAR